MDISALRPLDVLIVEDHLTICDQLVNFLGRSGLLVNGVLTGADALAFARAYEPRLLILDYNLPDMDGVQLADKLRQILPDANIIMMSGRIDGVSEKTLADLGISVFLNKPVPLAPLRRAVERLIREPGPLPAPAGGWLSSGWGGVA